MNRVKLFFQSIKVVLIFAAAMLMVIIIPNKITGQSLPELLYESAGYGTQNYMYNVVCWFMVCAVAFTIYLIVRSWINLFNDNKPPRQYRCHECESVLFHLGSKPNDYQVCYNEHCSEYLKRLTK